jgi:hypothetical protein
MRTQMYKKNTTTVSDVIPKRKPALPIAARMIATDQIGLLRRTHH